MCILCGTGMSTDTEGATNSSDCGKIAQAGAGGGVMLVAGRLGAQEKPAAICVDQR